MDVGNIDLYLGECIDVMNRLPDASVDMVLCDPPYGLTKCDWDTPIDFDLLWRSYRRIVKPNGAIVIFSIQPFTTDLINSNRKEYRYEIIWKKTNSTGFLNSHKMPLRIHENIIVFYRKLPTYNPQMTKAERVMSDRKAMPKGTNAEQYGGYSAGTYEWKETGERMPTDCICFSNWCGALFGKGDKKVKHSTQKPVPLLEYLIKTYTNPGDTVLDNCMGSGSTGVACVNTGRSFIGIEIERRFFDIAQQRIDEAMSAINIH